jgi:hypothetical protein
MSLALGGVVWLYCVLLNTIRNDELAVGDAAGGVIVRLRSVLRERFPEAHPRGRAEGSGEETGPVFETGLPCLDALGIEPGGITEIVSPAPGNASALVLASLLCRSVERRRFAALVDGRDSFDPQVLGPGKDEGLLWVRCRKADEALRATDLLLRDGNLPLVLLDLVLNPARELKGIPGSAWFRLRGLAEESGAVLLAFTPEKTVTSARLRLSLDKALTLDAFGQTREEIEERLSPRVTRRRNRHDVKVAHAQ